MHWNSSTIEQSYTDSLLTLIMSKATPILSFLKLVAVKRERNKISHFNRLPLVMESRDENLLRIDQMLTENNIDMSSVNSHKLFSIKDYAQLIGFLKKLA